MAAEALTTGCPKTLWDGGFFRSVLGVQVLSTAAFLCRAALNVWGVYVCVAHWLRYLQYR